MLLPQVYPHFLADNLLHLGLGLGQEQAQHLPALKQGQQMAVEGVREDYEVACHALPL